MESLSGRDRTNGYSDAACGLRAVKRDLTLDLFLRRGAFWREILLLREKWSINALVKIPQRAEVFGRGVYPQDWEDGSGPEGYGESYRAWDCDIATLAYCVAPKPFNNLDYYFDTWRRFLGAAVLCDPPETELLRFAAIGDLRRMKQDLHGPPPPYFPMVKQMRDWLLSAHSAEDEMWAAATAAIEKVAPPGVVPREILFEAMRETEGSQQSRQRELEENNPFRWYIEVDEHATEGDVLQAFRMLRAQQSTRPKKGRGRRVPLIAVQVALLHDKHNGPADPNDRRRRKWTHESLAEHFGLTPRGVEGHIKQGRELLRGKQEA